MSAVRTDSGFSLVEVLVALALLALVVGATSGAMSNGLGWGTDGERLLTAQTIARTQLENWLAIRGSAPGSGIVGRYSWQITEMRVTEEWAGDFETAQLPPVHIVVTVSWEEDSGVRTFELETLRLAEGAGGAG